MTWPPQADVPLDLQMRAFLDAIGDQPDDISVRLVFADWLEERADPRAQLVRLQAEWLRFGEASPERPALLDKLRVWKSAHQRDWIGEWPPCPGIAVAFEKGLLQIMQDEARRILEADEMRRLRQVVADGWLYHLRLVMWGTDLLGEAARHGLLASPRVLEIFGGPGDNERLRCLRDLSCLRRLNITADGSGVDDRGLVHLGTLTGLREFCLWNRRLTGTGLADLVGLSELRVLGLSGCVSLNDVAMVYLDAFRQLEHLMLGLCRGLSETGLAHLAGLRNLRKLDLGCWTQLTAVGMTHLRPLTQLRTLLLKGCASLSDAGLECLLALPFLEDLDLTECRQLTAAGLSRLAQLPKLRRLNLSGCTLRPHETRALRKAMPNCVIVRN